MEKISIAVLKKAAHTLLLDMSEEEYALLQSEFDILLNQMDLIGNIKGIDDSAPMTFPFDVTTESMREDAPQDPTPVAEVLKNTGHVYADQVKLPKVVG